MGWLMGSAEIASMLGVSRQRITQLTGREDFPAPAAELIGGRVWLRSAVLAWIAANPDRFAATLEEGTAMFEKFSEASRRAVVAATDRARERRDLSIDSLHLLLALSSEPATQSALGALGVTQDVLERALPISEETESVGRALHVPFGDDLKKALDLAAVIASHEDSLEVGPEHLLSALANPDQPRTHPILSQTSGLAVRGLDARVHELLGLKGLACSFCRERFPRLSVVWGGSLDNPSGVICGNCNAAIYQSFQDWE